jgi:hypothetical protein
MGNENGDEDDDVDLPTALVFRSFDELRST